MCHTTCDTNQCCSWAHFIRSKANSSCMVHSHIVERPLLSEFIFIEANFLSNFIWLGTEYGVWMDKCWFLNRGEYIVWSSIFIIEMMREISWWDIEDFIIVFFFCRLSSSWITESLLHRDNIWTFAVFLFQYETINFFKKKISKSLSARTSLQLSAMP